METLFVGQNQYFLPRVESTNTYATGLLRNVNIPEGTIVYTDHQTQGRGQRGNSWIAEPASNITASIILNPLFLDLKKTFCISKIAALAVHDVLTENLTHGQFDIKIKWPNDILVNTRKIAGILIENQVQTGRLAHSVIGIGLNVNQTEFGDVPATSFKSLLGVNCDRKLVLSQLCKHLEKWYLRLKKGAFTEIDQAYFQALYGYKQSLSFRDEAGLVFDAVLQNVTEEGLLVLVLDNHVVKHYDIKEITLLR